MDEVFFLNCLWAGLGSDLESGPNCRSSPNWKAWFNFLLGSGLTRVRPHENAGHAHVDGLASLVQPWVFCRKKLKQREGFVSLTEMEAEGEEKTL